MSDTTRVNFTRPAAERIASAVRKIEQGDRDQAALKFAKPVTQDGSGGGVVFRIARFTGSWGKNASKTVTFRNQTSTPNTVVALNLFVDLAGPTSTTSSKTCAIAREGTAWYLISTEC